jgi:hypothetical protein
VDEDWDGEEDDVEQGYVKVWFNEHDEPIEYHYYDEDGMLEAVTDADGDPLNEEALDEAPSPQMRAMFSKAFASTARSKKTGKPKDAKQTAYAARSGDGAKYYRKFRRKWTKTKHGKGVSGQAAGKYGVRVKAGKGVKGRIARAHKRRGKRTGTKHVPAEKISARSRKRHMKKLAASVEQFYDHDLDLIETWWDGECIAAHDPETGYLVFEHPEYEMGEGLHEALTEAALSEAPTPAMRAMFAKAFASTARSKKTGKPKDAKQTAYAARSGDGAKYYRKFRRKWTKTKAGKGVSGQAAGKYGLRVKSGKGMKTRIARAHKRRGKRTGTKHVPAEKISPRSRKRHMKKLAASYDHEPQDLLFEEEMGVYISEETSLVFDIDGDLIGALDEHGEIVAVEDLDEDWLDEAIETFEESLDEGGTTPEKAGVRMKGAGQARTKGGTNAPGSHGGGAAKGIRTKSGSPGSMRGGGKDSYGEEEYDESYDDSGYVTRLEAQIARQQEVIDAFQDLQQAEALETSRARILDSYPELGVVESRLARCQTVQEMQEEAEALLTLVESSRGSKRYGSNNNGSSVNSGNVNGAPQGDLLTETHDEGSSLGVDLGSAPTDTASRVAARRRRKLVETQN